MIKQISFGYIIFNCFIYSFFLSPLSYSCLPFAAAAKKLIGTVRFIFIFHAY